MIFLLFLLRTLSIQTELLRFIEWSEFKFLSSNHKQRNQITINYWNRILIQNLLNRQIDVHDQIKNYNGFYLNTKITVQKF
ncbi:hypothetical protein BpHYR1_050394 [Brachionus plicatilis]|uniref:Secreted protein n=1 Tax=Brachionus plicatilis TaxID=10195 RepID=A0A3M7SBQ6_BRAPC|nr:hypothetical protein BpHYR1_050394 [Brachionus plicatilis]